MFEKGQIVLVDTNVILEAHRVSCWNTLASHFRLATVEETQTGFDVSGESKPNVTDGAISA